VILSPAKKFIFVHVPKAAGTSIHGALAHYDVFHEVRYRAMAERERAAIENGLPIAAAGFSQHTSVGNAIKVLGRAAFDAYYSFCFVRNPWDVAVSWYHYRSQVPKIDGHAEAAAAGSFDTYVRRVLAGPNGARLVGLQYPYVVDDEGQVAVRFVGRHEALAEDFAAVVATLKLRALLLDHLNVTIHAPWASLYTPETFAIVAGLVTRDAELFGYSSDPDIYGISGNSGPK
jgi:hypothetical protein